MINRSSGPFNSFENAKCPVVEYEQTLQLKCTWEKTMHSCNNFNLMNENGPLLARDRAGQRMNDRIVWLFESYHDWETGGIGP